MDKIDTMCSDAEAKIARLLERRASEAHLAVCMRANLSRATHAIVQFGLSAEAAADAFRRMAAAMRQVEDTAMLYALQRPWPRLRMDDVWSHVDPRIHKGTAR